MAMRLYLHPMSTGTSQQPHNCPAQLKLFRQAKRSYRSLESGRAYLTEEGILYPELSHLSPGSIVSDAQTRMLIKHPQMSGPSGHVPNTITRYSRKGEAAVASTHRPLGRGSWQCIPPSDSNVRRELGPHLSWVKVLDRKTRGPQ